MAEQETSQITPTDPLRELDWFHSWWPARQLPRFRRLIEEGGWTPSVDISEDDEHFVVTAELPGARKEDVAVELDEGFLTIRGEKRSEREEKDEQRRYIERSYGSFSRSFTLPTNADPDRIEASFEDGVLTVEIAKREASKPKSIVVRQA